jgi:hypothetical protein
MTANLATLPAMSAFSNFLASRVQRLAPPAAALDAPPQDVGVPDDDAMATMIAHADMTIPSTQELVHTPDRRGGGQDGDEIRRAGVDDEANNGRRVRPRR